MKVEHFALVVRNSHTKDLIEVIPLSGDNGNALVKYPNAAIGSMDTLHEAVKGFPEALRKEYYLNFSNGKDITIEGEAMYMPSIGDVAVELSSKIVEWS